MKELGVTQADVAKAIGALPARVNHYLTDRNEPTLEHLMLIARFLHITTDWLLFGGAAEPIRVVSTNDLLADRIRLLDAASRRDVEGFIAVKSLGKK